MLLGHDALHVYRSFVVTRRAKTSTQKKTQPQYKEVQHVKPCCAAVPEHQPECQTAQNVGTLCEAAGEVSTTISAFEQEAAIESSHRRCRTTDVKVSLRISEVNRQLHNECRYLPFLLNTFIFQDGHQFVLFVQKLSSPQRMAIKRARLLQERTSLLNWAAKLSAQRPHVRNISELQLNDLTVFVGLEEPLASTYEQCIARLAQVFPQWPGKVTVHINTFGDDDPPVADVVALIKRRSTADRRHKANHLREESRNVVGEAVNAVRVVGS